MVARSTLKVGRRFGAGRHINVQARINKESKKGKEKQCECYVRFEVFTAVTMKNAVVYYDIKS
jgi:hypothetical protein